MNLSQLMKRLKTLKTKNNTLGIEKEVLKMNLNILYEDNHLIVVEKKPGVLTQPAKLKLPDLLTEVKTYLKEKYNKPGEAFLGMIHRLDTNVGGVIRFAKTSKAASRLSKEIKEQRFEKRYLTIVKGNIQTEKEVTLIDYLLKDKKEKKAIISNDNLGKKSILKYKKIAQIDDMCLLEVNLITGRFHQIRVQLANQGTPLYGDRKYGNIKEKGHLALYAYSISFIHPTKKEKTTIKHFPENELFLPFLKIAGLV